jgi:hypothetical protein
MALRLVNGSTGRSPNRLSAMASPPSAASAANVSVTGNRHNIISPETWSG